MSIRVFENTTPAVATTAYIDETALVIGDVTIGDDASLWPKVVARGDVNSIHVGARTNIQDGTILHVSHDSEFAPGGFALHIGADITVGHQAIMHGCTVEDRCLIGMAATVMDGAVIHSGAIVGNYQALVALCERHAAILCHDADEMMITALLFANAG